MKYKILLFLLLVACGLTYGQNTDLARIEYTFIPQSNSDNSFNRFKAFVNFPIKLGWEGAYIIPGVEYRNVDLDIEDNVPFETNELGKFQLFRAALSGVIKIGNEWLFALKTGAELASNFEENSINKSDINFTGAAFFIKDHSGDSIEKPYRIIVGLNYSTNAGRPFPIPILNYYKKFHPNWSYSVGTPKTNLKYFFNGKNSIQTYISLDGFFSNIQRGREVRYDNGTTQIANNISMTNVLGGLGYEHSFTKHLVFYTYAAHTFYNEIRLRDNKRNSLYKLNEENTFYIRGGIKFKI